MRRPQIKNGAYDLFTNHDGTASAKYSLHLRRPQHLVRHRCQMSFIISRGQGTTFGTLKTGTSSDGSVLYTTIGKYRVTG